MSRCGWMLALALVIAIIGCATTEEKTTGPEDTYPTSLHGARPGKDLPDGSQLFFASPLTREQMTALGFATR